MVVSRGKLLKVQYALMRSGRKIRTDTPKPPNAAEITLDTGSICDQGQEGERD